VAPISVFRPILFLTAFALCSAAPDWERAARGIPDSERLRAYLTRMAAEPHHAGSPASRAVAEYALARFREFGLRAEIETFEAWLPYPKTRVLEVTAPLRYQAKLREPVLAEDEDSSDAGQLPAFNAYAAEGDVTAPVVYVNYGRPEDYLQLKRLGVSVRGKIALARYGRAWRGIKAKTAQENGAVGCLIYSDPADDGFGRGEVYPRGRYRPAAGVQRGSVLDMPVHPGDPFSPGYAAVPGGRRDKTSVTLMKIPVLPISHEDAEPILRHLTGADVPASWRGGLDLKYRVGGAADSSTVHLKLEFETANRPVHNVIARLEGTSHADEWVIYGNHHDAWVNGAADPISGASVVIETARTMATLMKQGWRPKRTMIFALWDAEEYGIIGSTEWAEKHADELRKHAVVYFNSDTTGAGAFSGGGSPSLRRFTTALAKDMGVLDAKFSYGDLGAGSDYVAFAHHLGVASVNYGLDTDMSGVYHSAYDSVRWFEKFGDPGYRGLKQFTEIMSVAMLRFVDAGVPPFEPAGVADAVDTAFRGAALPVPAAVASEVKLLRAAAVTTDAKALFQAERLLLDARGLPGRPWYRNLLSAPGTTTGYAARTLPGVFEASAAERPEQVRRLAAALRAYRLAVTGPAKPAQSDAEIQRFLGTLQQPGGVTPADGRYLHDLIVRMGAKRVLEIGTSTGYSALWMAMGLRKTGGQLTSIEIHEARHANARDNFARVGLDGLADLRLADAVEEVAKLAGPFDLILLDAGKPDYVHYYDTLLPKLRAGGVMVAHDVRARSADLAPYLERIRTDARVRTEFRSVSPQGLSLSYKR